MLNPNEIKIIQYLQKRKKKCIAMYELNKELNVTENEVNSLALRKILFVDVVKKVKVVYMSVAAETMKF